MTADLKTVREAGVAIDGVLRELVNIRWTIGGMAAMTLAGFLFLFSQVNRVQTSVHDLETKMIEAHSTLRADLKADLQSVKAALKIADAPAANPDPEQIPVASEDFRRFLNRIQETQGWASSAGALPSPFNWPESERSAATGAPSPAIE